MPNYKGHIVGGTLAFALLLYVLRNYNPSALTILEWYLFTIIGALFPDIDIKSKGQKLFYQIVFLVIIFLLVKQHVQAVAFISFIALSPLLVRHRGITHSLWFIALLSCVGILFALIHLPAYVSIIGFDTLFFFAGAVSHLWLDLGFWRMLKKW